VKPGAGGGAAQTELFQTQAWQIPAISLGFLSLEQMTRNHVLKPPHGLDELDPPHWTAPWIRVTPGTGPDGGGKGPWLGRSVTRATFPILLVRTFKRCLHRAAESMGKLAQLSKQTRAPEITFRGLPMRRWHPVLVFYPVLLIRKCDTPILLALQIESIFLGDQRDTGSS
jgi:hypothetical protein